MIDPSIIEDILKHADIVDVVSTFINVIKKGRNFVAVCPFHDDKNPSMMLSRDKQIFKCFVCGTGGNVITFVQKYNNLSFQEAIKLLADNAGISITLDTPKKVSAYDKYYDINDTALKYYKNNLISSVGVEASKYLLDRGLISEEVELIKH